MVLKATEETIEPCPVLDGMLAGHGSEACHICWSLLFMELDMAVRGDEVNRGR